MITDVGVDLDGVIYPFANAFKKYCLQRMVVDDLPDPTHWNFYEDWGMDHETFQSWLHDAAVTHQVFSTEPPYDGVIDAWKDLRDLGLRIHVMTARPQSAWAQTAEWLSMHNLHVDTLHFGPTKTFLRALAADQAIMIDDHVYYYKEAEKVGIIPVLMDRQWNSHKTDATRVSSLAEFVSLIRGYNIIKKVDDKKVLKAHKEHNPWEKHTITSYNLREPYSYQKPQT